MDLRLAFEISIRQLIRQHVSVTGITAGQAGFQRPPALSVKIAMGCVEIVEPLIRTNNVIERLNREIRRRTRVVGTFPDGNSALMLVCARLRHVAGTQWGCKKYMNMKHLEAALDNASIAG